MLTKIHIHSAFSQLFQTTSLRADLNRYDDLPRYLGSVHPKFKDYVNKIYLGEVDEGYVLLDKNLMLITPNDLLMKVVKSDDEFYVVPAIIGGGGGKGLKKMLTFAAVATAAYFAAPYVVAGAKSLFATAPVGADPYAIAGKVGQSVAGTTGAATASSLSISASTLAVNAGLALVTSLFTQRPEALNSRDQSVRENNMFGSLQNTIDSGTPVPLIYGAHRVAGQFISGYVDSIDHGENDDITVLEQFEDD